MSNTRLPSKQEYIKELKQQIDSKPSKLEQYKQKLNERELYEKDNLFNHFGSAGGGASLRNEDGRVKTTRRTMLNDNYEELTMNQNNDNNNYYNTLQEQDNQQIQQQMMNRQNKIPTQMVNISPPILPPQQIHQYQEPNMNYQQGPLYNTQRIMTPYQQIQQYNQMNNGAPMLNMNTPSYIQNEMNNTIFHLQNSINNISNNYRNVQSARTPMINPNKVNNEKNLNEVKIIPIEHQKNIDKLEIQKKMLRDDWIRQIEARKQRLKEEKQKQIEKDRLEEMKWQKYLEEQKESAKNQNEIPKSPQPQSNLQQNSHTPISVSKKSNVNQNFEIIRNNNENNLSTNIQPPMLNYATISRNLDDTIDDQIAKLRNDVSLQYVEMSNLFNKLKMNVAEANQLKSEAEKELKFIRDELLKTKMNNILYENKLNQVLEQNAPYNNFTFPSVKSTLSTKVAIEFKAEKIFNRLHQWSSQMTWLMKVTSTE